MITFICDRCKESIPEIGGGCSDSGVEISRYGRPAHLCKNCVRILSRVESLFYNSNSAIEDMLNRLDSNNHSIDDDDDDHTSVWGGEGPDCINARLEAA